MKHICTGAGFLLFLAIAPRIDAHGPSLKVEKTTVAPGEELTVRGEGITVNGEVQLTLQGILEDHPLGHVRGDEHGRFETTLALPGTLSPGDYTLIASGDETATVKLTIQESAGNTDSAEPTEHAEHGERELSEAHLHAASPHANPEAMDINRSGHGVSRGLAWGLTLVSGLLGVSLLIKERRR